MKLTFRIWALILGAAAVAVILGGWFLGVAPQLSAAGSTSDSAVQVEAQNQQMQIRLAALSKTAAKVDSMKAEDARLQQEMPSILKPNRVIRRFDDLAALDGVTVKSVSFSDSAPYSVPASATGVATGSGAAPAPVLAKTDPAITAANFTVIPVIVSVTGTQDEVFQFAHDLQNDQRTFAIDGIQTTKDDTTSTVIATFDANIYTLKR